MTIFCFILVFCFAVLTVTQTSVLPESEAKSSGFSIELIHSASKRSPASLSMELVPEPLGGYYINFSVGTPPKFQLAVADTGSHVNWIQCEPCVHCYSQNLALFSSLNSSTYKAIPCNSSQCFQNKCEGSQCTYALNYMDRSYSSGDLGMDIFTFYSPKGEHEISFPDIVFGCAHSSNPAVSSPNMSGLMGLGVFPWSLISQISAAFGKRFFYCFVPLSQLDVPSTFTFGENAWGTTGAVLFTPISLNPNEPFYLLTLVGISVNGKRFNHFTNNNSTTIGNIAIDSGTTLTNLPTQLYNQVETAILQAINVEPFFIENSTNPCCRDFSGFDVPPVTIHFIAEDVPLSKDNIIWPAGQGIWCLAFKPTEGQAFYGNVAQTNFLVGYDLNKMIVSFKPTDCTKMA